jgi:bacteriorhodopsin
VKILLLIGVVEFGVVALIAGIGQAAAGQTTRQEQMFQIFAAYQAILWIVLWISFTLAETGLPL